MDVVAKIMQYESGEMSNSEVLEFFAELMKTGLVNELQGSYGRAARRFVDAGYLDMKGKILKEVEISI